MLAPLGAAAAAAVASGDGATAVRDRNGTHPTSADGRIHLLRWRFAPLIFRQLIIVSIAGLNQHAAPAETVLKQVRLRAVTSIIRSNLNKGTRRMAGSGKQERQQNKVLV